MNNKTDKNILLILLAYIQYNYVCLKLSAKQSCLCHSLLKETLLL